jgi:hypothetical protein
MCKTENEWPEETDLLRHLVAHGWSMYAFGRRLHPDALAAVKRSETHADVIIMRGHDRSAAYRTLDTGDPLRATQVTWHYLGDVGPTIHAALRLVFAYEPSYPIPPECQVPETDWHRFTLRISG